MTVADPLDPPRPSGKEMGFLFLQTLAPEAGLNNVGWAYECGPDFDGAAFEQAIEWLLRRHPALRTTYPADGAGGYLRTTLPRPDVLIRLAARPIEAGRREEAVNAAVNRPYDLTRDLPLRVELLTAPEPEAPVLVLGLHHIAIDATSAATLLDELDDAYRRLRDGALLPEEEILPPDLQSPPDVRPSADPQDPAAAGPPPAALAYWRDHLAGFDSRSMLMPGSQRVREPRTFAGGTQVRELSADFPEQLRILRKQLRATNNILMLGAFYALLLGHGAGPDLAVGTLVTERRTEADQGHVGHRTTMLALRVRAAPEITFRELVLATRTSFLDGVEHSAADFDAVLPHIRPPGDWRTPVFRQVFTYWPEGLDIGDERTQLSMGRTVPVHHTPSRYELVFNVMPVSGRFLVKAAYSTELFEPAVVGRMLADYEALLAAAAADPDGAVIVPART